MTAPQEQRIVSTDDFLNFIHTNLGNALRLIQEAQTAIDQMAVHLNNRGATAHLKTKEEVLAERAAAANGRTEVKMQIPPGVNPVEAIESVVSTIQKERASQYPNMPATHTDDGKGNVRTLRHDVVKSGPTEEEVPGFAAAVESPAAILEGVEKEHSAVVDSLMKIMGKTREEAEAIIKASKEGKGNEAKRQAAELLIPTDEWIPLFVGPRSIFADFLCGEIYQGGRGPIEPRYTSPTGQVFKQYSDDLNEHIRDEDFLQWPTGFYRNKSMKGQIEGSDLQFKLNLIDGSCVVLTDFNAMPIFIDCVGAYKGQQQRVNVLPFPALRDLYDEIQKSLFSFLKTA